MIDQKLRLHDFKKSIVNFREINKNNGFFFNLTLHNYMYMYDINNSATTQF